MAVKRKEVPFMYRADKITGKIERLPVIYYTDKRVLMAHENPEFTRQVQANRDASTYLWEPTAQKAEKMLEKHYAAELDRIRDEERVVIGRLGKVRKAIRERKS